MVVGAVYVPVTVVVCPLFTVTVWFVGVVYPDTVPKDIVWEPVATEPLHEPFALNAPSTVIPPLTGVVVTDSVPDGCVTVTAYDVVLLPSLISSW